MGLETLIQKYSGPGPRYTSYPTAPQWLGTVGVAEYRDALNRVGEAESLALYVHLPFCEKLCYYCGCNIQVTGDKSRSRSYVEKIQMEIQAVSELLGARRRLTQVSWGGGTPTFLNLEEIRAIQKTTRACFDLEPDAEVSIEIDPRVTTREQLLVLREEGFNRTSLGVQDFEPAVQEAINRVQPAAMTADTLSECRRLGFEGINFDLIYGLPLQTLDSFRSTIEQVVEMSPDRIALYNYARLPSLLKHQVILEKFPMPSAEERVAIFSRAFEDLTASGYEAIGMDHFALKKDGLAQALGKGQLYRNFMGYTVKHAPHLIGIGASAISEVGGGFFQNVRKPADYESTIGSGNLATLRGMVLSEDDLQRKWVIQQLMCRFELPASTYEKEFGGSFEQGFSQELGALQGFFDDGILEGNPRCLRVTEKGRLFVRNVAMVFDAYLHEKRATFSQTV